MAVLPAWIRKAILLKRQEQSYEKNFLLQISSRSYLKQRTNFRNIQSKELLACRCPSAGPFLAETEEPRAGLRSGHSVQ
jgi:thiosulfate/3-mercaptopyruvate sulfurtransferase